MLGDVVLSLTTISRQAVDNRGTVGKEFAWALCHGVLHLLGYDHQTDEEEDLMRGMETRVLAKFDEEFYRW
jgi:probable rRNA maturation factor